MCRYLASHPAIVIVHDSCHSRYTDKRRLEKLPGSVNEESTSKKLRSHTTSFCWKQNCFLCGKDAVADPRHRDRCDVKQVKTLEIRHNLLSKCAERNDQWALEVRGRLKMCADLHAFEAVYHKTCHVEFLCVSVTPSPVNSSVSNRHMDAFTKVCDWLENSYDDMYTMSELHTKM